MAALSFPEYHVTGAVHHYVRPAQSGGVIYYLGTAEVTPKVRNHVYYRDIMNDIAGRSLPGQRTKDGEAAMIGSLLSRFSKAAYGAALTSDATAGQQIHPLRGTDGRYSRGALVFGQTTFELWCVFENYWNTEFRTVGMTPGLYFPQVSIVDHDRDTLGTEGEKLMLVMDAQPYWTPQASPSAIGPGERRWFLYSDDENYFPADVQVPQ